MQGSWAATGWQKPTLERRHGELKTKRAVGALAGRIEKSSSAVERDDDHLPGASVQVGRCLLEQPFLGVAGGRDFGADLGSARSRVLLESLLVRGPARIRHAHADARIDSDARRRSTA